MIVVLAVAASAGVSEAGYVQSWVDSRGGCERAWSELARAPVTREFLGRASTEWTDEMVNEYSQVVDRCFLQVNGFPPSYDLEPRRNVQRRQMPALREFVERGKAAEQQRLAQVRARETLARESAERERQRLLEQAKRDREAAEEALRAAEAEEPKIAEAAKEAEEARRAHEAAQQRLAEVRSRLAAEHQARREALARAQSAEASRQQELHQEAERSEDAQLSRKCTVSLDQFKQVQLGMSLREVERLFGCKGTEVSGTKISGYGVITTYTWEGGTLPSAATATFRNSRLESKAQIGLE